MKWRNWIPGLGNKTVRQRIKELENIGVGLSVLVGTSYMKTYESLITTNSSLTNWILTSIVMTFVFIYWDEIKKTEKEAEKEIDSLKEKIKE